MLHNLNMVYKTCFSGPVIFNFIKEIADLFLPEQLLAFWLALLCSPILSKPSSWLIHPLVSFWLI